MFKDYTLQTTWGRALMALAGGAVVGAGGLVLFEVPFRMYIWKQDILQIAIFWTDIFFWALYYVSIALFLAGSPIWLLAHKLGFRTWQAATFVGFLLPFSILFIAVLFTLFYNDMNLANQTSTSFLWEIVLVFVLVTLFGIATALTIWRIAYRRPAPC